MATVMLEGGADMRFVQEMLGHARLDSTQIYTQVSIRRLQAIHAATYPAARLARHRPTPDEGDDYGQAATRVSPTSADSRIDHEEGGA